MELQGLPLEIAVRPGKRKLRIAEEIQDLPDRIAEGQMDDEVILNALAQLRARGEVINGGLKSVGLDQRFLTWGAELDFRGCWKRILLCAVRCFSLDSR